MRRRKRPLPALPRKIGIVTSLDGAAIRDIIKVLRRRHPNAHLVIRPARVQGDGAADDVAQALRAIVQGARASTSSSSGAAAGRSRICWAFNEEVVARAIAASPVPVISAVGHESRRDDRRLRRRPARADAVGRRRDGRRGEGRVLPPHRSPGAAAARAVARAGLQRRRAARARAGRAAAAWRAGRRGSRCAAATPRS